MAEETPEIVAYLVAKLPNGSTKRIEGAPANNDMVAVANLIIATQSPDWGGGRG